MGADGGTEKAMKKLTADEKIARIAPWLLPEPPFAHPLPREKVIAGIVDCPYGDDYHYHYQSFAPESDGTPRDVCPSCSKADGSECVDEFIYAFERTGWSWREDRGIGGLEVGKKYEAMREWRRTR
jgi:hypothetical protein